MARKNLLFIITLLISISLHTTTVAAENIQSSGTSTDYLWNFDTSMTYETGDFGTSETTDTLYMPFTMTRYFRNADAYITIPYIYQESAGNVTMVGGKPTKTREAAGSTETSQGLGDIIIGGGYYLLNEDTSLITLKGTGSIKLPTADEDEGLGTGEFDETFGMEASKLLTEEWRGYFNLYYTFIGEPNGESYDNQISCSLGAGYLINPKTEISAYYSESTAVVDDADNARAISTFISYAMDQQINLSAGISLGLTDGSPDLGLNGSFNVDF